LAATCSILPLVGHTAARIAGSRDKSRISTEEGILQLRRRRIPRPSPALIVSVIALCFACSGVAIGLPGKNTVDGNDLKKNVVRTKNIKNKAVTGAKIANGAVAGTKIADGAVDGAKVAPDSLSGAQINESSLGTVPNAGSLGGSPPGSFASTPMWALVNKNGNILRQSGGITVVNSGSAVYQVTFPQSLNGRAISAVRAFVDGDGGNSVAVEVGACGIGLNCGPLGFANDERLALVVTTGLDPGPPASIDNEEHAFWIAAH
jgi:hypothetical protein